MKLLIAAAILLGSWSYNASSNERVYWLTDPAHHLTYTCGFVSVNHLQQPGVAPGEGFVADVVRPGTESRIGSQWFSQQDAAEAWVAEQCGGVR